MSGGAIRITCGEPEMIVFAAFLLIVSFVSIHKFCHSRDSDAYSPHFWVFHSIWLVLRAVSLSIHISSFFLARVLDIFIGSCLQFLALSAALTLMAFVHFRSISVRDFRGRFFRLPFAVGWAVSALIGAVFSITLRGTRDELIRALGLWRTGIDLTIVVFGGIPGVHLFWKALARSMSAWLPRAGLVCFLVVALLRMVLDIGTAAGRKIWPCGMTRAADECTSGSERAQLFVACLLNDGGLGILGAAAVNAIESHWQDVFAPSVEIAPSNREIIFSGIKSIG
jgi:hypothetical protein